MYDTGDGVYKNKDKAAQWFEKSEQQEDADVQYDLGILYSNGNGIVPRDTAKSMQWYEKAALQGDAWAQFYLGSMYYKGEGVAWDKTKAKELFQKAAEQGYKEAKEILRKDF